MKFEKYLATELKRLAEEKPIDRPLFDARIRVFFGLVARGVDPARARRIMDLYLEGEAA